MYLVTGTFLGVAGVTAAGLPRGRSQHEYFGIYHRAPWDGFFVKKIGKRLKVPASQKQGVVETPPTTQR